jgi:serine protease
VIHSALRKSINPRYPFFIILTFAVLLSVATNSRANQISGDLRVFVKYAPRGKATVEQVLRQSGARFHYKFDRLNTVVVTLPGETLNRLESNPFVLRVEQDAPRYLFSESSNQLLIQNLTFSVGAQGQSVPYGVDAVQARDVWDQNRDGAVDSGAPTGQGRTVCIIDSGYYADHEDLPGKDVASGYSQIPGENWWEDGLGHGTHVAGTIAGLNNSLGIVGVTPGTVTVYIVKIFDNNGSWTNSSDLIDAANRCADNGANVISMSLGGSVKVKSEEDAFQQLYDQGVLSVAAAGNAGNNQMGYPASYPAVISVAAVDENNLVADFSQRNNQVELAAPGVNVLSTVPIVSETNTLTVDSQVYTGNQIEFAARGTVSGILVDGGLCDSTGSWSGNIVLCERGTNTFLEKVSNVQTSGGSGAVIYNNAPGNFLGTLGEGNSSAIPAISLSQVNGQYLVGNKLGANGNLESISVQGSGYEAWSGTSMATPHVSAVAALIWSADPAWTNVQIRAALQQTALDLGAAGRDNAYGFGLVQAASALQFLSDHKPTATPTATSTGTPTPTFTSTSTPTPTSSATNTPTPTKTDTPTPTSTSTSTQTPAGTLTPAPTSSATGTSTVTPTSTPTSTHTPKATDVSTNPPSPTSTSPTPIAIGGDGFRIYLPEIISNLTNP